MESFEDLKRIKIQQSEAVRIACLKTANFLTGLQTGAFLIASSLVFLFAEDRLILVQNISIDFRPLIFWLFFILGIFLLNQLKCCFSLFESESHYLSTFYESSGQNESNEHINQKIVHIALGSLQTAARMRSLFIANVMTVSFINSVSLFAALFLANFQILWCFFLCAVFFIMQSLFCKIKRKS